MSSEFPYAAYVAYIYGRTSPAGAKERTPRLSLTPELLLLNRSLTELRPSAQHSHRAQDLSNMFNIIHDMFLAVHAAIMGVVLGCLGIPYTATRVRCSRGVRCSRDLSSTPYGSIVLLIMHHNDAHVSSHAAATVVAAAVLLLAVLNIRCLAHCPADRRWLTKP